MSANQHLGAYGERRARQHYERAGYEVLAQNWRCETGEIDLIAARDGEVVICEVKTRATNRYGLPVEAVDWRKQRRLRTLAAIYLREESVRAGRVRFDVVSITSGRVNVIENAF